MEVAPLCIRLLLLEFLLLGANVQNGYTQKSVSDAVVLRITPNRLQFFEYESFTCHCDGTDDSIQLRGIRNTEELKPACVIKGTPTGSSCTFNPIYQGDSGEYWFETNGGKRSNSVNITVTAGSVILDSPALPVMEGDTVTLRCRSKSTNLRAVFYKDGVIIKGSPAEMMTIKNVSKTNEGLYYCRTGSETSPRSWLAVRVRHFATFSNHEEPLSNDPNSRHVLSPLWVAITILMVALVLLLVGFLHIRKHRAVLCFSSKTPTAATHSEHINQIRDDPAEDANTLTYAVVVTKQRKNKDAAGAADNTSLHLERTHSRKPQGERDEDGPVYSTLNIKRIGKKGGETPS